MSPRTVIGVRVVYVVILVHYLIREGPQPQTQVRGYDVVEPEYHPTLLLLNVNLKWNRIISGKHITFMWQLRTI